MNSTSTIQDVLVVAFGGPTKGCCKAFDPCPGEAWCFVSGIFGHNPKRKARIEEVTSHYTKLGGFSDFNQRTEAQAAALQAELGRRGHQIRVHTGYHHWNPYVRDVIGGMKEEGRGDFIALILAPHQSSLSWDAYLRLVAEGIEIAGEGCPEVVGVAQPFWNHEGFIAAIADRIRQAATQAGVAIDAPDVHLLLSAHAIPQPVAKTSPYCRQIEETAALVAAALGKSDRVVVAYQSQPGDSNIPWTGPSLEDGIDQLKAAGAGTVLAAAIGFLCDNVEVLWDLGVEGEKHAQVCGLNFVRAESVHDHPSFIAMLADQVEAAMHQATHSPQA